MRAVDGHEYDPRDDQPIGEAGLQSDPLLGHQPVGDGERRGVGRGMGLGECVVLVLDPLALGLRLLLNQR